MDRSAYQFRIDQWKVIIHDQATSSMSKAAWCRENNVNLRQFFYWQRKLRNMFLDSSKKLPQVSPSLQVPQETTFCEFSLPERKHPVPLSSAKPLEIEMIIEIKDCRIYIGKAISKDSLASVIEVLRHV